jgi:hypothetical protein
VDSLRARQVFSNARIALIAIESVDFQYDKTDFVYQLFGNKKPIAIVVCSPDKTDALDMEGRPLSVEQLRQNIPELAALIKKAW